MISIKELWDNLEMENRHITGMIELPLNHFSKFAFYLGYIPIAGTKVFQFEIEKDLTIESKWLQKFKGVEIQILPYTSDKERFTILLLDQDLEDIFVFFVEDILEKCKNASNTREVLIIINRRVHYWRKLFAKVSGDKLTPDQQRGLFGELSIIQLLLQEHSNKHFVINSWIGSQNSNQDFAFNKNALEVKTSKAGNPSVHVSNEYQLDYSQWDNLFLSLILVTESAGSTNTLCEIINLIQCHLSDDNLLLESFDSKLSLLGLTSDNIEDYNDISYNIRSIRYYKIDKGFPIITECTANLDLISHVKYQIAINECKPYLATKEEFLNLII